MYDNVEVNRKHNTFKLYVCIRRNYQTDVCASCFENAWTDLKMKWNSDQMWRVVEMQIMNAYTTDCCYRYSQWSSPGVVIYSCAAAV